MRLRTVSLTARALAAVALLSCFASSPTMALAACGDGIPEPNEQCDPGPDVAGDCCNSDCNFVGAEVPCSDDGNQCTSDFCDGEGTCLHQSNFGSCDDGNDCTVADFCDQFDQCVSEGLQENGSTCADAGLCGGVGFCQDGFCAGDPVDCNSNPFSCQLGTCNTTTGSCEYTTAPDGTACGVVSGCIDGGSCETGECIPKQKDCSAFADACNDAACDPEAHGGCYSVPKENGTTCDDANGCTVEDACSNGECTGSPRDCSSLSDGCHTGVCNGDLGDCVAETLPDGTSCDDGDPCTLRDECSAGTCGGTPKDCSAFSNECHEGSCDAQTGNCQGIPFEDGTSCDDGNACTTGDQCSNGECFGAPLDCSSLADACNSASCNPDTGACEKNPLDTDGPCDDGNACTTGDSCNAGSCAGSPVDCSASGDQCNNGTCDPDTGSCTKQPVEDGTTCSDDNLCTTADACSAGACAGTAVDCSASSDQCNTGACNPQTGSCIKQPVTDGTSCNDQAFCTQADTCVSGSCTGSGDPCASGDQCSSTCNEAADNCLAAAGTSCTSDGNPCTDDACDGDGSCAHTANTDACDDGLFCTSGDTCADGECVGGPTCPETSGCGDTCNEAEDACRTCGHPFSEQRCVVNAIFVLQAAVGLRDCELCTCDVDANGSVNTSDALRILRTCVGLPVNLDCPEPSASTTTSTTVTSTTLGP